MFLCACPFAHRACVFIEVTQVRQMMHDRAAEGAAAQRGATPITPRSVVVGIGAEKSVPAADFEAALRDVLHTFGLTPESVRAVATLDRRAAEEGFATWTTQHGWPVRAYTAEQLAAIQTMPHSSTLVAPGIETSGVCEPAAMLASGKSNVVGVQAKAWPSDSGDCPMHRRRCDTYGLILQHRDGER